MEDNTQVSALTATTPAVPKTLTLQEAFGIKSQIEVLGFEPGHPLAPMRDPNYVWEKSLIMDILEWLREPNPDPLWVTGPTGCGKTEMVVQLAACLNAPTIIITGRRDAEPGDILGRVQLVNGSTVFIPALPVHAYKMGWLVLIDEIDSFSPEVGVSLHRMLERKPLELENGDVVHPAARQLMAATANTRGDGDGGASYNGTSVFNIATLNRFEKWCLNYPAPDIEESILAKHLPGFDPKGITAMVKTANDIRQAHQQGNCPGPISIRDLVRWGRKSILSSNRKDVVNIFHSFDKAFGNGVDPHVRAMLHKLVQTNFGVQAPPTPAF
jgi:cobaltochelatase CobS